MFSSLLKFKYFKYYLLIIVLILAINFILLLHTNFNSPKKHVIYGSDIYEERGPHRINKKYVNNARRHGIVSNDIHQDILYELDMLDKYFLLETRSEYIQNKYKNLVSQLKLRTSDDKKGSPPMTSTQVDELNSWLLFQPVSIQEQNKNKYYSLISKISAHLCRSKIVRTDLLNKGTQLKFLLTLDRTRQPSSAAKRNSKLIDHNHTSARDQVRVVFKPKWYESSRTFPNVIDGKDRHYGELVGFLLSVLLEMYRAPLTVLTEFKMAELVSTASNALNATYFQGPGNSSCFQGKCLYCTRESAVCSNSTISGALILYVANQEFTKMKHPYQRSYIKNSTKPWQSDPLYCFSRVAKAYDREVILDIVDMAVFDFLLQNGDRHHLEKAKIKDNSLSKSPVDVKEILLLFDNGKSFGNHAEDNLDILAPLYQCCTLRSRTYNTLVQLRGGLLIRLLKSLSKQSACSESEVLTEDQWRGMQRRLNLIYATVNYCVRKHEGKTILVS